MHKLQDTICIGLTIDLKIVIVYPMVRIFFYFAVAVCISAGINSFVTIRVSLTVALEIIIICLSIGMHKFQKAICISLTIFLKIIIVNRIIINRCYVSLCINRCSCTNAFITLCIGLTVALKIIISYRSFVISQFQKAIRVSTAVFLEIVINSIAVFICYFLISACKLFTIFIVVDRTIRISNNAFLNSFICLVRLIRFCCFAVCCFTVCCFAVCCFAVCCFAVCCFCL